MATDSQILAALHATGGNRTKAARRLQISTRSLYYRLKRIPPEKVPPPAKPGRRPAAGRKPRRKRRAGPHAALWAAYGPPPLGEDGRSVEARNRLVIAYRYLVDYAVAALRRRGVPVAAVSDDELRSAGYLGLMEAVKRFDPARGVLFGTYAPPRIRGAMLDDLRNTDPVPRLQRQRAAGEAHARQVLTDHLGRRPTDDEVAGLLGLSPAELAEGQPAKVHHLDAPLPRQPDDAHRTTTLADVLPGRGDQRAPWAFQAMLRVLETDELVVLYLNFEKGHTLKKVGEVLHLSESRISQLRSAALRRLRDTLDPTATWESHRAAQPRKAPRCPTPGV